MKFKEQITLKITQDDLKRLEYMSEYEILANFGSEKTRDFNDLVSENIQPGVKYKITVEEI